MSSPSCESFRNDPQCTNHGRLCLPANICICDVGWTALNDYSVVEGVNCTINKMSIKVMSAFDFCMATFFLVAISRHIFIKFVGSKGCPKDSKALTPVLFLCFGLSDIISASLKLFPSEPQIIGRDWACSVAQSFFCFTCFVALVLYYQIILNFLHGYTRAICNGRHAALRSRFKVLQKCSWLVIPFSIPAALAPSLSVAYPAQLHALSIIGVAGTGILVLIYGVLFITALGFLLSELTSFLKSSSLESSDDLRVVHRRMSMAYYFGGGMIIFGSGAMTVFGSWDFLLNKASYIIIGSRLLGMPIFMILMITLSRIAPNLQKVSQASQSNSQVRGSVSVTGSPSQKLHHQVLLDKTSSGIA